MREESPGEDFKPSLPYVMLLMHESGPQSRWGSVSGSATLVAAPGRHARSREHHGWAAVVFAFPLRRISPLPSLPRHLIPSFEPPLPAVRIQGVSSRLSVWG